MSEVTTLLAWLIPCLVIFFAFIAWRIYVYRTRGPVLPSYLQRNIFARTRSIIPRTLSFGSNKDVPVSAPTSQATALRNETRIDMPSQQPQQMASIPTPRSAASQSFAPVPCEKKKTTTTSSLAAPASPGSIPSTDSLKPPTSPAIERLLSMK